MAKKIYIENGQARPSVIIQNSVETPPVGFTEDTSIANFFKYGKGYGMIPQEMLLEVIALIADWSTHNAQEKQKVLDYIEMNEFLSAITSEIRNDVTPPYIGFEIFNTDYSIKEWWDGDVWLNNNLVKCINKGVQAMVEGNPVYQFSSDKQGVVLSSIFGHIAIFGVVKDVYNGGVTGSYVTVAINGEHNVLCNGTVNRNELIKQSSTIGQSESTGFGSTGSFGVTRGARTGAGASLVKCIIQPTERY